MVFRGRLPYAYYTSRLLVKLNAIKICKAGQKPVNNLTDEWALRENNGVLLSVTYGGQIFSSSANSVVSAPVNFVNSVIDYCIFLF